jgi:pimeloyl-ACP methyl ester carboxylesterase
MQVYYEECGNPNGKPVVIVHGGPGGGCSPQYRTFHDPEAYRIILFDQRGAKNERLFHGVITILKMIVLPRQARDKHRESAQNRGVLRRLRPLQAARGAD